MDSSTIYGLESQGRALCSHSNEAESIRFFVGTLSPRFNGQVHQLDFDEETNQLTRKIFKPDIGEIWQIQCSPTSANLLALNTNHISERTAQMEASLWRLPNADSETQQLEKVAELPVDESFKSENVSCLDWHPNKVGSLATVLETHFQVWDVEHALEPKTTFKSEDQKIYSGKWNPHLDGNQFTFISQTSVTGVDLRSMKEVWTLPSAHKYQVRDVDFNPNKQYYFASCGDDCAVRFWDIRKPDEALKVLPQCHSHWVWRVRYNSFHDQLVLTAGSDSRVILHSLTSISSEPKGHAVFSDSEEEADRKSTPLEEGVLAKYEEHEDAVYSVEWSNYDPWTFASLSYDGRVVINRVPKSYKYKILL